MEQTKPLKAKTMLKVQTDRDEQKAKKGIRKSPENLKGSDQWEGRGFGRSPNHYMLVGEVVLDVFFVILMDCHIAWRAIYCSASKAKKNSICSK